ncbi:hypothetical protein ACFZ8E_07520 [Methylobacterium sp. HMF5984]|uniref:hypothetical protein n=1 Tax=Methylobacterium sp. HMF5984 TaxID=3367370 RepID=UPI0038531A97
MTEDEIIARGSQATIILNDERIMYFFDEMKSLIKDATFNTEPGETVERERLYYQLRGIEDVLNTMLGYSAKAEELLAAHSSTEVD